MPEENNAEQRIFNNPNLVTTGDIEARGFDVFETKNLIKCGSINACDARLFLAPKLQEAGYIDIKNAKVSEIQELKKCLYIDAGKIIIFNAPELQESGVISAISAKKFYAPKLKKSKNIYLFSAEEVVIKNTNAKIYCNTKTKIIGNCPNVIRNDSWVLVEDVLCVILENNNGVYKMIEKDGLYSFYAIKNSFGEWAYGETIKAAKDNLLFANGNRDVLLRGTSFIKSILDDHVNKPNSQESGKEFIKRGLVNKR